MSRDRKKYVINLKKQYAINKSIIRLGKQTEGGD